MELKLTDIFETENCSRCGGTGEYSYNPMDGRRCFKCAGGRFQFTRKHSAMARDLMNAIRSQKETTAQFIQAGDVIAHPRQTIERNGKTYRPWIGVRSVEFQAGTPEKHSGWSQSGGVKNYRGYIVLTLDDESIVREHECSMIRRKFTLDAALRYCEEKTARFVRRKVAEVATQADGNEKEASEDFAGLEEKIDPRLAQYDAIYQTLKFRARK
jgi:hypothetical protein